MSNAGGNQEPRVSIIVPAYQESDAILPVLQRFANAVQLPFECLVIVDSEEDSTIPAVEKVSVDDMRFRTLINTYGRGPSNAIRFGIDSANAPCVVVTMADGSDDPRQIDTLVELVERGVVVAAASRYMAGGQQVGGPLVKSTLSRTAGLTLRMFARVGTSDATNSFKAYNTDFVREVGIDSREGFVLGLELTAKARRLGLPVAEIPTIWLERDIGESHFEVKKWLPYYLKWYRFAFGPKLTVEQLKQRAKKLS